MAAEIASNVEGPITSTLRTPLEIATRSNPMLAWSLLGMWAELSLLDPLYRAANMAWIAPQLLKATAWAMGLQAAASVAFLCGAVALLRPVRVGLTGRRWWHPRRPKRASLRVGPDPPAVGDDPIGWKERYVPEGGSALSNRWGIAAMSAIVIAMFADPARLAALEWFRGGAHVERDTLNEWLRGAQTALGMLWMLAAAVIGAGSIAGEREKGTWESLTATTITGREVVRGKVFGTLWATRGLAAPCAVLWTIGMIGGAVHPVGVLASAVLLAALLPLAASIGVGCSMAAPNGNRALWTTMAILLGSQLFVVLYNMTKGVPGVLTGATIAGVGPAMLWAALLAPPDLTLLRGAFEALGTLEGTPAVVTILGAALAVSYAVASWAIRHWTARRYDAGPDRSKPRRRLIDRAEMTTPVEAS